MLYRLVYEPFAQAVVRLKGRWAASFGYVTRGLEAHYVLFDINLRACCGRVLRGERKRTSADMPRSTRHRVLKR